MLIKVSFLFLVSILTTNAFAADEINVRLSEGKSGTIRLLSPKTEMAYFTLIIDGKIVQVQKGLGSYFETFEQGGESKMAAAIDLDGDGVDELITRSYWEVSSGIHVFKWDAKQQKFQIMETRVGESYIIFPKGSRISLDKSGNNMEVSHAGKTSKFVWNGKFFKRAK